MPANPLSARALDRAAARALDRLAEAAEVLLPVECAVCRAPGAALCRAWGGPLVSTSANLAGEPPARSRAELDPRLLRLLDGILDGETGGLAQPTPIRDALSGNVLRS